MIPEIGGRELEKMAVTISSEQEAMREIVAKGIETAVVISPHNLCFYDAPAIFVTDVISGNLSAFGRSDISMDLEIDRMLSEAIVKEASPVIPLHRVDQAEARRYNKALSVDWGTFVPMYYLIKAGFTGKVVLLSPCFSNYELNKILGAAVERAASKLDRKIGIIASGDLSHRLSKNSPNATRQTESFLTGQSWMPSREGI